MPVRWRHQWQVGLTLIELVVSIAILAIIGGVVGAAYSVGLKAIGEGNFGNGHTQDRLAGAHDEMAFEQLLSQDVSRSACIWIPGSPKYGSCAHGFATAATKPCADNTPPDNCGRMPNYCPLAVMCLGWPQYVTSPASWSCEVAAYYQDSSKSPIVVRRQEYTVASTGSFYSVIARDVSTDPVSLSLSLQAVTSPSGPTWVSNVTATLTGTGVTVNQPVATLVMRPVSVDPAGTTAAIGAGSAPC